MSTQVDERVVSLQFDNARFEKNTAQTMSTLDKLKAKLHFKDSGKGLDELGASAEKVGLKFNAMYTVADQAVRNITNSVMAAGKKIVNALTIDPVRTGWNEYELKMNSVQTIMASTGASLKKVNKYLDELNTYSDKTIYSFSDMTQNIGKFTNAGVKLDDAVMAIKGISNEAALSGANANEASRAMYNFAQALSVGYIQRIDWKSIELANMATMGFKEQLLGAAVAAGTVKKTADGMYTTLKHPGKALNASAMFTEALSDQWLTTEVLVDTLKDYADETTEIGKKATQAATEVKTASQMFDTLKESAQSGWARTWEIIFGDFEEGKNLWTSINNVLGGFIDKMSKARNAILESALGKTFTNLVDRVKGITKPITKSADAVKDVVKSVKDYEGVVNEIISGKWGNGQKRWDDLTKSGYDWAHAQNLVNEKLGDSTRHATKYSEAANAAAKSNKKAADASSNLSKEEAKQIEQLTAMSDAQLKSAGYSDDQIKALRELKELADKLGLSVEELVTNVDEIDGRWLLLETFKNVGKGLLGIFKALKKAWQAIFPPKSTDEKAEGLFNIIAALHKLSKSFNLFESDGKTLNSTGDKIVRTFKGVFAVFDLVRSIVGGVFKIIWKVIKAVAEALGYVDISLLDVTAAIGDALVACVNWIKKLNPLNKIIGALAPVIAKVIKKLQEWWPAIKDAAKGAGTMVKEYAGIGWDIISGLTKGLSGGAKKAFEKIVEIGQIIIKKIKDVLGIHSPSKVFFAIGGFIIAGLIGGLLNEIPAVNKVFSNIGGSISGFLGSIDWSKITTTLLSGGLVATIYKFADAFNAVTAPLKGAGDIMSSTARVLDKSAGQIKKVIGNTAKVVKSASKVMNAFAFNIRAEGFKKIAIALGILVAGLLLLTLVEPAELWNAVAVILALSVILLGLSFALDKMNGSSMTIDKTGIKTTNSLKGTLVGLGIVLLAMAATIKILGNMSPDQMKQGFLGLAGCVLAIGLVFLAFGTFVKGKSAQNIDKAGKMLKKLAVTLILLVIAIKLIGKLSVGEMVKGGIFLIAFGGFVTGLFAATKLLGKNIDKVGGMILKLTVSMLLLVLVIKLVGKLTPAEMIKGVIFMALFGGFVVGLMAATKLIKGDIGSISKTLIAISVSMLILVFVCKLIATMDVEAFVYGLVGVAALAGIMALLIAVVKSCGNNAPKIGTSLLALAGGIAILAVVAIVLSLVNVNALLKGIAAVAALSAIMAGLVYVARGMTEDVSKSLWALVAAIGVMALAIGILSIIKPAALATSTAALSAVVGMFALVVKSSSKLGKDSMGPLIALVGALIVISIALGELSKVPAKQSLGAAAALGAVLAELMVVLKVLSKMNADMKKARKGAVALLLLSLPLIAIAYALKTMSGVKDALTNAAALGLLMAEVTGILAILSKIKVDIKNALLGVVALTAMAVPMLAFVGVLAVMQGVKNATDNTIALTTLVAVCSIMLLGLCVVGNFIAQALLGVVALTAMAVPLLAFVGVLAVMQGVENAAANALVLTLLMSVLGDLLFKISLVAPLAIIGVAAITALVGVISVVALMVVALGALLEEFPQLQTFIDNGIPLLIQLAGGLGEMISAFVGGLLSGLPEIGLMLSQFMINAMPFVMGIKLVDLAVLEGIGILTAAIIALCVASVIEAIASFITLGGSFADLGTQLSQFITNAMPFLEGVRMIDPTVMNGLKALVESILLITAGQLLEGITSWLTGSSSIDKFAKELPVLGEGLRNFIDSLGPLKDKEVAIAERAAKIVKTLAEASAAIPNTGGLLGDLVGNNDMGPWAAQLPIMAMGLANFTSTLTDLKLAKEHVDLAASAAEIIKTLAEAAKAIPNTGGLLADLVGDNSFGAWAEELPTVAKGIKQFCNRLCNDSFKLTTEQVELSKTAAEIVGVLAKVAKDIPNTGGWLADLIGDNSFADWAKELPTVAEGVRDFAKTIGTFSDGNLASVKAATQAMKALAELGKATSKGDMDWTGLAEGMKTIGGNIKTFTDTLGGISHDSITAAEEKINRIITLAKTMKKSDIEDAKGFGDSLAALGKDAGAQFVSAINSSTTYVEIQAAASTLLKKYIEGAQRKTKDVQKAFAKIGKESSSSAGSAENKDLYTAAGKDMVKGFAKGIDAQSFDAEDSAEAMGKKALKALKDALKEKSPSKETYKIGEFAGIGFSNALYDHQAEAYNSAYGIGEYAKNGLQKAVAKVRDIVEGKIDAQPTIRPILDLSDVTSGARSIGNLLDINPTIGAVSNARAISSLMGQNQNGANDDVISAIKDLKNSLNNQTGDSYNINGITYDDGSNISNAIKTITRQVRLEGRI